MNHKQIAKVDLARLGIMVRALDVDALKDLTHGGRWLSGAAIGHGHNFRCVVSSDAALSRLVAHFGVPNSLTYHRWDTPFLRQRNKTSWEYILLVDERHLFALYDYKGDVSVGYRVVTPGGGCFSSRADFEADDETCERFCRYIEAVVNFPPGHLKESRRWSP